MSDVGTALIELSDLASCVSGDFHCMHLNITGADFDTMHRKVLKTYYEEAAEDYDELAEKARMYGTFAPNQNGSAERISYQACEGKAYSRDEAIARTALVLEELLGAYKNVFNAVNSMTDCVMSIGVANFLQTRIEYWSKELHYFNKSRSGA